MGNMTVGSMFDYVRAYLDVDDEDLADTLLDMWCLEGTNRIQRAFEPWMLYEHTWTFACGHQITFADIADTNGGVVPEVVQSVEADRWLLRYRPHEREVGKYAWSNATAGHPTEFSIYDETVFIWPVPNGEATYTARGYRRPVPASSKGSTVDLPAEFDPLVCEWMLTRAYEWQDDEIMSAQKLGRFEQQLELLRRRFMRPSKAGVQQIGSEHDGPVILDRLAYSWEW